MRALAFFLIPLGLIAYVIGAVLFVTDSNLDGTQRTVGLLLFVIGSAALGFGFVLAFHSRKSTDEEPKPTGKDDAETMSGEKDSRPSLSKDDFKIGPPGSNIDIRS